MRRPRLDQDHVASDQTGSIGPAPRIGSTPKHHCSIIVCWVTQDLVKLNGEAVEVADMQRSKVGMEGVVEKGVVNGEVDWGRPGSRDWGRSVL